MTIKVPTSSAMIDPGNRFVTSGHKTTIASEQQATKAVAWIDGIQVREQDVHAADKFAGNGARFQTQKISNLSGSDQNRDAVCKSNGHGARDELDRSSQPRRTHHDQHDARHHRDHKQTRQPKLSDDTRDDDHKSARRPPNLGARPAQRRNQTPGNDCRIDTGLRGDAGSDAEGHRQRQGHQSHRQPGDRHRR